MGEGSLYSAEMCEKVAGDAALRYVKDSISGIRRQKKGRGFAYYSSDGQKITDKKLLSRIQKLGIPPAYRNVWICPYTNGHIQATGRDERNRKQYIYHPLWQEVRQQQKFGMMLSFGKALPQIRQHVQNELAKPLTLERSQLICALIYMLDHAGVRIGSPIYAKENQSYGLTTVRKKHLIITEKEARLEFIGKHAQQWQVILKNRKIINILKKCEEIPGYELFKYRDEHRQFKVITSQEVNHYLQEITGYPFTAKDFRTWAACRETLALLKEYIVEQTTITQKVLKEIIKQVAQILRHTPSICKKCYIHPDLIEWSINNKMISWLKMQAEDFDKLDDDALLLLWLEGKD